MGERWSVIIPLKRCNVMVLMPQIYTGFEKLEQLVEKSPLKRKSGDVFAG